MKTDYFGIDANELKLPNESNSRLLYAKLFKTWSSSKTKTSLV